MQWYYTFLVRQPYLMVLAIAVLCSACIIVSLTTKELPDFTEPTLGFEARGTEIGKRLTAWNNLLQETERSVYLFANPNDLLASNDHGMYDNNFSTIARRRKFRRNRKRKDKKRKHKNHNKFPTNKDLSKKIHTIKNRVHENSDNLVSKLSPAEWNGDSGVFRDYEITNETMAIIEQSNAHNDFEYGRNMSFVDEDDHQEKIQIKSSTWRILKQANSPPAPTWNEHLHINADGYFCESPTEIFSHFIVERIGPNSTDSLFDLNGMLAMCQLQDQITSVPGYGEHCEKEMTGNCCRPWSLPNYVALLSNKSSCFDLNQDDIVMVQNLLVVCFGYFHSLKLSNDCNEHMRCHAPLECTRYNAVFNILHYLTDFNFIKNNDSNIYLKYAMVFVPVTHSTNILPLFHEWEKVHLQNELVQVAAMDLGLENELFNESLLKDGWLVALGGVFVMTCMWLYTTSLFVTGMTCLAVVFALGLAYFIYTLIFEMSFFPYMNLLAVVVIIGIGADDAFIFVKIWQCVLEESFTKSINTANSLSVVDTENTETLKNLMTLTLRHAALSMFVTSVTTAGAFYASYISYITSIKCFGIFAGTAVITNYLLMITWLPASVAIMERFSASNICGKLHMQMLLIKLKKSISKLCTGFENFVVNAVLNYALVWVLLFAMIGVSSAVIVLYSPGLQLPDNSHFQLFVNNHPFEIYESKLKHEFWFEKSLSALKTFKLPLRFVWGIMPIDDGDYANPYAQGNLYYDNNFNISTKSAQVWLLEFCQRLKEQPFYQLTLGMLLPNCFIENFISSMNRMCIDTMDSTDRTPCCDVSKFPYEPHIFDLCLPKTISMLYATPRQFFLPGVAGPKFFSSNHDEMASTYSEQQQLKDNNTMLPPPLVKALVIEFESNVSSTTSYHEVKKFVQTVDDWFTEEIRTAPNEMQGGWFTSELKFFGVQDTLSKGTKVAIAVAMVASLVVLLAVTLNVLISLFAVLTVSLTIFTTVAVLILLGWKLNILESVAVSTAIGLAVDFSLHYSIHYRLSQTRERDAATQFSLKRIIGPTAMAALTTIVAGVLMLFSTVLPYIQIGLFLVVVTSVSWIYATFFLMSLLKLIGPQYDFMQFSFPKFGKHPTTNPIKYYDRKQSQVIASEQLLTPSSSAVGELINSESHELDSLTSNSLIKTISGNEYLSSSPIGPEQVFHQNNEKTTANSTRMIHKTPAINYQFPSAESTITLNVPVDVGGNFK